jgi:hypothetical protein
MIEDYCRACRSSLATWRATRRTWRLQYQRLVNAGASEEAAEALVPLCAECEAGELERRNYGY